MQQLFVASPTASLARVKAWARDIRRDAVALWLAARDPRTPLHAKIVAACVAAYALSPIDLIPDFIPVLGYLDDLLVIPLGIVLVVRLIPPALMAELRAAALAREERPVSRVAGAVIGLLWAGSVAAIVLWLSSAK